MDFSELEDRVVRMLLDKGPGYTRGRDPREKELLFGLRYGNPLSPLPKSVTGRYENV